MVLSPRLGTPQVWHLLESAVNTGAVPPRAWRAFATPTAGDALQARVPDTTVPTVWLSSYFGCRACHAVDASTRLWES
ncbi:MAG: hypothetical protein OWU84_08245 [Firmicutes bacterium]|nr:hypothetical protein [Bacillota bacterium]